jgi:hypothetical protein
MAGTTNTAKTAALGITPAQLLQADRQSFPGLLPREILVFRAWLKLHESEYDRFDYNVRLGSGFDPGPTYPQNIRDMAVANTQKRVDAVGYKGEQVTLIEVKDRAGFSAVGQLVGYLHLYKATNPTKNTPRQLMVANRIADDLMPVLIGAGIELQLVEADFTPLAGLRPKRA